MAVRDNSWARGGQGPATPLGDLSLATIRVDPEKLNALAAHLAQMQERAETMRGDALRRTSAAPSPGLKATLLKWSMCRKRGLPPLPFTNT